MNKKINEFKQKMKKIYDKLREPAAENHFQDDNKSKIVHLDCDEVEYHINCDKVEFRAQTKTNMVITKYSHEEFDDVIKNYVMIKNFKKNMKNIELPNFIFDKLVECQSCENVFYIKRWIAHNKKKMSNYFCPYCENMVKLKIKNE